MVDCHCQNNRLRKQDLQRPQHTLRQPRLEGSIVLARCAVLCALAGGGGGALVGVFAGGEDDGGVGFFEEEEADDGIEGADDGEDPEDPAPA